MQHLQGPAGNYYDKYGTKNPIARLLVQNFLGHVKRLVQKTQAESILDAGCGEGHVTRRVPQWMPNSRISGCDVAPEVIAQAKENSPHLDFSVASIYEFPFSDCSFDLVMALEVFEHLEQPELALHEVARVAKRFCLFSVPREPLWRMTNMLRGAYLSDWGNTPGHINHWSTSSFTKFLAQRGKVLEVMTPYPWTIVLWEPRA